MTPAYFYVRTQIYLTAGYPVPPDTTVHLFVPTTHQVIVPGAVIVNVHHHRRWRTHLVLVEAIGEA